MSDADGPQRWAGYQPGSDRRPDGPDGPGPEGASSLSGPPGYVSAGVPKSRTGMHPFGKVVLAGVVLVAVAGVGIAVWAIGDTAGVIGDGPEDAPQTVEGYAAFADAIEEEVDSTEVYEISVYTEFAYAQVPVDGGDRRSITYQWIGGNINEWTKASGVDERTFDMRDVDAEVFTDVCAAARDLVDDGGDCSLQVRRPDEGDGWISANVSNDFSEYGYVTATLDGTVIDSRAPGE